jgi:Cu+-exporting ATPase
MTDNNHHHHGNTGAGEAQRDPVCGMAPDPNTPHRVVHEGEDVLFCSAHCKT